ncbi:type I polyketide synthase, partial [Herbidospora mongoliensis]|uniref:type I polyketide synthase n=1 Tax=Herbidospora mongoliensis TaxID=688067 RepID=UPI000A92996C
MTIVDPAAGADRDRAVAIVGISCRLPGADSPALFWELLRTGRSAIGDAPADRWDRAVAPAARRGGFLDAVGDFDADFFGISPREAAGMDPQQRLVLELVWEALEDGRIVPASLRDGDTSMYVGTLRDDYSGLVQRQGLSEITQHTITGVNRGVIANRVSYFLGLRGASLTVDTAQSSSLVALHLAAESLRAGDAGLSIVAGVNLNLTAESAVTAERFGGLSPDGLCFTFDARANGFVRGEGGVVVVLKRLADALADGDRVHAVLRGGAVNNDGATPGLTVPGRDAQEQVIRQAYDHAGVAPERVQYVELHGTGTRVGDPIEAAALGAALGAARDPGVPLLVGSAKTNVGHLEGAAGLVGLLKVVLSIRNRELPPSLNFETPNPAIALDLLNLSVQTELAAWPRPDEPLVAGVSSFGMGGTNCHVVVTEAPAVEAAGERARPGLLPWLLSGRDEAALRAQAAALTDLTADPLDVGASLLTRSVFGYRAVVVGADRAELVSGLEALGAGLPGVVSGVAGDGRLGWVFSGQGAQRVGMGAGLAGVFPVFAEVFGEVCGRFEGLAEVIASGEGLERTGWAQPGLFAVEVALARLLESWGVRPDVVVGHSIGEVAAAHVAGVLSLSDAVRLVEARGRLMQALPEGGAMWALQASEEEVVPHLFGRV